MASHDTDLDFLDANCKKALDQPGARDFHKNDVRNIRTVAVAEMIVKRLGLHEVRHPLGLHATRHPFFGVDAFTYRIDKIGQDETCIKHELLSIGNGARIQEHHRFTKTLRTAATPCSLLSSLP